MFRAGFPSLFPNEVIPLTQKAFVQSYRGWVCDSDFTDLHLHLDTRTLGKMRYGLQSEMASVTERETSCRWPFLSRGLEKTTSRGAFQPHPFWYSSATNNLVSKLWMKASSHLQIPVQVLSRKGGSWIWVSNILAKRKGEEKRWVWEKGLLEPARDKAAQQNSVSWPCPWLHQNYHLKTSP